MSNEIQEFFNRLAPTWDKASDDDLTWVSSVLKGVGITPKTKILDLACGTGVITGILASLSDEPVLGMDLSDEMIKRAKAKYQGSPNIAFICQDFLKYEEGAFDFIVIYNAYPHFIHPRELSQSLAKNLTSKGRFLILHSRGKEAINAHHKGISTSLSRNLTAPEEEWGAFEEEFNLIQSQDHPDCYLILGEKKN